MALHPTWRLMHRATFAALAVTCTVRAFTVADPWERFAGNMAYAGMSCLILLFGRLAAGASPPDAGA